MSIPSNAVGPVLDPVVREWIESLPGEEDPLVARLEAFAADRRFPLIGRTSGRWLELLTRAIDGRRVFEFGSGFGYSAFFFARAVGEGGLVVGTEIDAPEVEAFHALFAGHPLAPRIDLRLGRAEEILPTIDGPFDAFLIDCDKKDYLTALELAVPRLRPGGLLLADNVLWGGRTAREIEPSDGSTLALRAFTERLFADDRLLTSILPTGDGLAVAYKR